MRTPVFSLLTLAVFAALALVMPPAAHAGEVETVDVEVRAQGNDRFAFHVTLRHGDTGWEHYANLWKVVGPDGRVLGKRVLAHPHVNEQPFTRSLSGVEIPSSISEVTIRARDSVHGMAARTYTVDVPHK